MYQQDGQIYYSKRDIYLIPVMADNDPILPFLHIYHLQGSTEWESKICNASNALATRDPSEAKSISTNHITTKQLQTTFPSFLPAGSPSAMPNFPWYQKTHLPSPQSKVSGEWWNTTQQDTWPHLPLLLPITRAWSPIESRLASPRQGQASRNSPFHFPRKRSHQINPALHSHPH